MTKRQSNLILLSEVFNNQNLSCLESSNRADVIEMKRILTLPYESLSNQQLEKCLEYLSIQDGKPYEPLNVSAWSIEQLENRLFELDNKAHETN